MGKGISDSIKKIRSKFDEIKNDYKIIRQVSDSNVVIAEFKLSCNDQTRKRVYAIETETHIIPLEKIEGIYFYNQYAKYPKFAGDNDESLVLNELIVESLVLNEMSVDELRKIYYLLKEYEYFEIENVGLGIPPKSL